MNQLRSLHVAGNDAVAFVGLVILAAGIGIRWGWDLALVFSGAALVVIAVIVTLARSET